MIGVFDSGLGGLTVVKEIFRVLPDAPILYLGDLARMPYGTKSKETICKYAEEDAKFLIEQGARVLVIACNTASSLAYDHLRAKFPEIPIFEVVIPAARQAAEVSKNGKIGVIGTRATVGSKIYEKKILDLNPGAQIFLQSAPLLVPLIEEGWLDKAETKMILRQYLYPLCRAGIDTLILGCTHFPLIKDEIQHRIGKRVKIINSAEFVVKELTDYGLRVTDYEKISRFFVTDLTPHWQAMAEKWLARRIQFEKIQF